MESYRRDTTGEPLRDPETGQVLDPAGTADGRTDGERAGDRTGEVDTAYDHADHDRGRHELTDDDELTERDDLTGRNDFTGRDDFSEPGGMTGRDEPTDPDGPAGTGFADGVSERDRVPGFGEPDAEAVRAKQDEQADLIVYPDEADYPTRSDDDGGLTAGVPDLEPEPVLATSGSVNDNDAHRSETGHPEQGTGSADFQQRWREVQAGFVDDPRDAVERADQLVEEAVTALTSRRQGLVDRWKNSDQGDTEQLRLALRDYRSLLEELVGLSYSTAGHGSLPASQEVR
ncbi:hypothetical protein AB0B89_11445 [Sphaerisporangium sp. NPDC049002]|uniref:hypothetical protein n=1 Tax=Sphaerisporangium sp. NPDC049002 TaxID=3155392 RepID=UPI0033E91454